MYDDKLLSKIEELKIRKVKDIPGALADSIYNEKDFLCDMLGDKIYDAGKNKDERLELINKLKIMRSFDAWKLAMNELEQTMI